MVIQTDLCGEVVREDSVHSTTFPGRSELCFVQSVSRTWSPTVGIVLKMEATGRNGVFRNHVYIYSGVHYTHCSATKIFGSCDTRRSRLHSCRRQICIFLFFSMHFVMCQFSKYGVLNAVKRFFLLISKTFHNWYLKQHGRGIIWV